MLYLTSPIEQETVKDIFGPLYRTGGIVCYFRPPVQNRRYCNTIHFRIQKYRE